MFCNGFNNFGMGFNPGMGMMGSNVKITQTTTGMGGLGRGGSIFGTPGGFTQSYSMNISNGSHGFLGGLSDFFSGFNAFRNGGMLGGGSGLIQNPLQNLGLGGSVAGTQQQDPELAALNNLNKSGKWSITRNPDGTFTALLEAKYNKDGTQATETGDYKKIQTFMCGTTTIDPPSK